MISYRKRCCNSYKAISPIALNKGMEKLNDDYQALFIGPNALPAPPWGSVYLDKEAVIFGSSLLELRNFMRQHGISLQLAQKEPEDHFGLMMMMALLVLFPITPVE